MKAKRSGHKVVRYGLMIAILSWGMESLATVLPPPVLIKPLNGGMTSSRKPAFDWSDVYGASTYDLQVDTHSDFSAPIIDTTTSISGYTPGENLSAALYYWRVRARAATDSSSWTSPFTFTIYTPMPTLFSPTNNGETTDRTPTFDWSDVSDATGYHFQLSTYSDLSSPMVDLSLLTSNYTPSTDLAVGSYYWRVRTQIGSDYSSWTATWKFTVIIQPPMLISPFNNSQTTQRTPSFDWSDTPGAIRYDFQLSSCNDFSLLLYDLSLTNSNYALTTDLSLGTYYWRVRAWVGSDSTAWSTIFSFTVVTVVPTLWFPSNFSQTADRTPRFDWSAPVGAESYDLHVSSQSDFSTLVIAITTTESEYTPDSDLELGLYYWRVRIHSETEPCTWSDAFQFTIISAPQIIDFRLNNGAETTVSQTVTLNNTVVGGATHYMASENADFSGGVWQLYSVGPTFLLSAGAGYKTVYFKVKNETVESNVVQDQINFIPEMNVKETVQPVDYALFRCYPNPFYATTTIILSSPSPTLTRIGIYDLLGRRVRTLTIPLSQNWPQKILWDGTDQVGNRVAEGVYFLMGEDDPKTALKVVFLR